METYRNGDLFETHHYRYKKRQLKLLESVRDGELYESRHYYHDKHSNLDRIETFREGALYRINNYHRNRKLAERAIYKNKHIHRRTIFLKNGTIALTETYKKGMLCESRTHQPKR